MVLGRIALIIPGNFPFVALFVVCKTMNDFGL